MKSRQPNILFVFPDQWRNDWTPQGELPLRLPHFESVRRKGVSFAQAITPSPLCAPARACLATGKTYEHCSVKSNADDMGLAEDTFYTRLSEAGYQVLGCGKFDLAKSASDWGTDGQHSLPDGTMRMQHWGFNGGVDVSGKIDGVTEGKKGNLCPYTHYLNEKGLLETHITDLKSRRNYFDSNPTPLPDEAYLDNFVGRQAVELIQNAQTDSPWFLQVNFCGPHSPMDTTQCMFDSVTERTFGEPKCTAKDEDLEAHKNVRRAYAAMIENIDRWLGEMLACIRERGEEDNTLIVIASDHGDMLGDKGHFGKNLPYHASIAVPLVIAGPGVQEGMTNYSPISLIDLSATFLDYGLGNCASFHEARSMKSVLEGKTHALHHYVSSGLGNWRLIFDGRWKWITGYHPMRSFKEQRLDPQPVDDLLFDLQSDPLESNNRRSFEPEKCAEMKAAYERTFADTMQTFAS